MTKAALIQICSTASPAENLATSVAVIRQAAADGAKVFFLPEAADFIVADAHECFLLSPPISKHEYTIGLQNLAKELKVQIHAGIHNTPEVKREEDKERVYNTLVVIGEDGEIVEDYNKVHLFDITLPATATEPEKRTGESVRILPGSSIRDLVASPIGKIGLEICYDIRFPEIHAIHRKAGADIISIPSAFTLKTGLDHWYTMVRSVAIMYQVYVIASAQAGAHNPTRSSWGESLAFDPWGRQLARLESIDDFAGDKTKPMPATYAIIDIDLEKVAETRKAIPLEGQKRWDVYGPK